MIKEFIRKQKIRFRCDIQKHDWEYYTWGNAIVNNLDDTFGFWDIASRHCTTCSKTEHKLKHGWAEVKGPLFITDLTD